MFEVTATGSRPAPGHDAVADAKARTRRMAADPLKLYAIMSLEAHALMERARGKVGVQWGHAFMHAFWDAEQDAAHALAARRYKASDAAFKIGLAVETTEELLSIYEAHEGVCGRTLVEDRGLTVFDGPTITLVGLGPVQRSRLVAGVADMRPWS